MKANGQHASSIALVGQYEVTVLEDGRIRLPSDIARLLRAGSINTLYPAEIPGLKALVLCPEQFWKSWKDHIEKQLPPVETHPGVRAYTTPFKPIKWDSQGRISPPASVGNRIGIKADSTAILLGKVYYLELWAEDEFTQMKAKCEDALRSTNQQE